MRKSVCMADKEWANSMVIFCIEHRLGLLLLSTSDQCQSHSTKRATRGFIKADLPNSDRIKAEFQSSVIPACLCLDG